MTERIQDICSCCIFVLHRGIKLHFFLYNATQMNIIVYPENNVFTGNLVNQGFPHDMYNGFESRLALLLCPVVTGLFSCRVVNHVA